MQSFRISALILSLIFLQVACANNPERFYFGSYSEAEKLYNKGEYEAAIEQYQAYRDEFPEGNMAIIAQYYIGKSYVMLEKSDEAKKIFQDIVKKHPDVVWANFSKTQLETLNKASAPEKPKS